MRRLNRSTWIWILAGLVVGGVAIVVTERTPIEESSKLPISALVDLKPVDARLGSLPVVTMEADPIDLLTSEFRVLLIDFWATWCRPCLAELPALERIQRELGGRVALVGVLTDGLVDDQVDPIVKERLRAIDLSYPTYIAVPETFDAVYRATGKPLAAVPTKVFLTRDHQIRIRYVLEGVQDPHLYRHVLEELSQPLEESAGSR